MKKILLPICLLLLTAKGFAQSPLGDEGNQFSLSTGYTNTGIPLIAAYEMGIHEHISFGIEGALRFYNESGDTSDYAHTIMGLSFFSNYYFNELLKLDEKKWGVYAGLNLGYYKWISPSGYNESGNSSSTLAFGIQLGGRYYFGQWGVFLEVVGNNDSAGAKLGATYKL